MEAHLAVLRRTPAALQALLSGLPEEWTHVDEGARTWSAIQIVAHMVQGEQDDWMPRARWILEHGETRAFVPFDRFAHLSDETPSLQEYLDRFAELRRESLAQLAELAPDATQMTSVTSRRSPG